MNTPNSRVLALNILNEPGIIASGIRVPKLKSCPKCKDAILSDPPQSITTLSCDHVFHRTCIEKDLLNSKSGEARCPIPSCHRDVENIKVNADLSPTRSDILVIATSTQDTMDGNEMSPDIIEFLDTTDIVEFLDKDKTTSGNNDEPVSEALDIIEFLDKDKTSGNNDEAVSEAHDSELVSKPPKLTVPIWIKEKLNAKNNADYEFMKALGLLEEPLEAEQVQTINQTSADKGNVKTTTQATSAKLVPNEEREHNSLNKESQSANQTGTHEKIITPTDTHEKIITPTASERNSTTDRDTSPLKRDNIPEGTSTLNVEGSRPNKVPRNDLTSDKKEKKESHVLKGLIQELTTDTSEVFEDPPLDGNADDFLYLYHKITSAEARNEITNQDVIRCYYSFGKVLSQRFKYHFEKCYNEHTAQIEVNREVRKRLPSDVTDTTIRKKAERARKIYMLFSDNREGIIGRVRSYSAIAISKLSVEDIAQVIASIA